MLNVKAMKNRCMSKSKTSPTSSDEVSLITLPEKLVFVK